MNGSPILCNNLTGEVLFEEDRIVLSNLVSDANNATTILLDGTVKQLDSNCPDYGSGHPGPERPFG